jgi:hypothetical protein
MNPNFDELRTVPPEEIERIKIMSDAITFGPSKKLLSMFIFKIAKNALARCKRKNSQVSNHEILEVFILTIVGLESLINEICLEKIDQRQRWKKSTCELKELMKDNNGKYFDLKTKYEKIPNILWNNDFNKGGRIWGDFDALVKLRNDIVHYSPKWEQPGYVPDYIRAIYRRISPPIPQVPEGTNYLDSVLNTNKLFIDRICHVAMGHWAYETGINLVRELFRLWPRTDSERTDYQIMFERAGIKLRKINK